MPDSIYDQDDEGNMVDRETGKIVPPAEEVVPEVPPEPEEEPE